MSDDSEPRSWLTRLLLDDPDLLTQAAALVEDDGGTPDAYLAARRLLDSCVREAAGWPQGSDYGAVAHQLGDHEHARLVWGIAGTDTILQEARARWAWRYACRAPGAREELLLAAGSEERLTYSEDGVLSGVDGARYIPGYLSEGPGQGYAVAVLSRGLRELVTGFAGYDEQRQWLADRGTTATGPLNLPGMVPAPRAVLEERVLASLLAHPDTFGGTVRYFPPDTFTADARYEIYAAMTTLAESGRDWYGWQVPSVLDQRVRWLPDEAITAFGGPGAPWLQHYARRLSETPASAGDGDAAAREIHAEDQQALQVTGWFQDMAARAGQIRIPEPQETPDLDRWARCRAEVSGEPRELVQRPAGPSGPGGPGGLVPRL
jgi:hypothetical protein